LPDVEVSAHSIKCGRVPKFGKKIYFCPVLLLTLSHIIIIFSKQDVVLALFLTMAPNQSPRSPLPSTPSQRVGNARSEPTTLFLLLSIH
jgi:hypothetical protein